MDMRVGFVLLAVVFVAVVFGLALPELLDGVTDVSTATGVSDSVGSAATGLRILFPLFLVVVLSSVWLVVSKDR